MADYRLRRGGTSYKNEPMVKVMTDDVQLTIAPHWLAVGRVAAGGVAFSRSYDNGLTWVTEDPLPYPRAYGLSDLSQFTARRLVVDPRGRLYVVVRTASSDYVSDDFGKTLQLLTIPGGVYSTMSNTVSLVCPTYNADLSTFLAAGPNGSSSPHALFVSSDVGDTWTIRNSVLPAFAPAGICHFADGNLGWMSVSGRSAYSSNKGVSWTMGTDIDRDIVGIAGNKFGFGVAASSTGSANIYATTANSGQTWTVRTGGGANRTFYDVDWAAQPEGVSDSWNIFCAVGSELVSTVSQPRIERYVHDTGLGTWGVSTPYAPAEAGIITTIQSRKPMGVWLAGTVAGKILRSADYGATWSEITSPFAAVYSFNYIAESYSNWAIPYADGDILEDNLRSDYRIAGNIGNYTFLKQEVE